MITAAGAGVSQLRRLMFTSAAALFALLWGLPASSATSSAWSRQGLPIEYLMVPSPSMNRQIRVGFRSYRGAQLQAMKPDLQRVLGAG